MFEIRIHGRGGQGAKSSAQFIAEAALKEGKFIQAFSEYGPERSGAPVVAYVRISDQEIKTHEPVICPSVILVLDETLIKAVDVAKGLKKDGILIINSSKNADVQFRHLFQNIKILDASSIALEFIGKDKPNTAMLGALVKITQVVKLENLIKVIKKHFLIKVGEQGAKANITAVKKGYLRNYKL
ncbi:pyruvate synthase [Candidatus Kuenenbacteria bacterium HGW-Kuenenbacteria-1]|uniref:Pyruvate synthase n=1 Tax=Candidatus Kuenenbacteria bacterium HGW-Kuenenbacteria-1 TaxID=2013812 RepID=A0A2N1UP53_9BACT|nr:MAG: pyruvate synthase [Candidatus Kuenenbacteria bacterium HGW-Kuenenbacteria-1]